MAWTKDVSYRRKREQKQMKFDMHCHTKEGSMDGKVPIDDFIAELIRKGFDGMLVSDHNSYNGYRAWKRNIKEQKYKDFVVLKGIEYDTIDAGHILVIMPENSGASGIAGTDPDRYRA